MAGSIRQGGRIIADALAAQGVSHVFSVPGESFLPVLDGFHAIGNSLRLVTCRFEAGAVKLSPGAPERIPLWQLYPLLIHVNLFAGSYVALAVPVDPFLRTVAAA